MAKKAPPAKAPAKKTPAAKLPAGSTPPKPIKETLNKTGLVAHIAQHSGVDAKAVRKVLLALDGAMKASLSKKGAGLFLLPGLLKVQAVKVPAKPKRKGLNRFTGQEQWFAAKPASLKIKVRALKKLKDAAA